MGNAISDTQEWPTPSPIPEGTPVTIENLLAFGYRDFAAEQSAMMLDMHPDPFYYYKGDFKVYDLGNEFYVNASQERELKGGARVETMEKLAEMYQIHTGRLHTPHQVLEDTAPVEPTPKPGIVLPLKSPNLIKAKLKGGPGDGEVVAWPKNAAFYIRQITVDGKVEGHRYKRKAGTKKTFLYIGVTE